MPHLKYVIYLLLLVIIYFITFMVSFCLEIRFMATLTFTFKFYLDNLSTQNFMMVIIIITFKHYTQLSLGGNDNYTQTMLNFHLVIIILLVVDNVDDYYGFTLKKGLRMNFGPLIKFS